MKSNKRFVAAAILAPLSVPLAMEIFYFINSDSSSLSTAVMIFMVASLGAYAGLILVGMPTIYFLNRLNRLNYWTTIFAGVFGGALVANIIDELMDMTPTIVEPPTLETSLFGAACGFLIALVFSIISGQKFTNTR